MNEFDLIRRYFSPLSTSYPGAFNLTDDAALIDLPLGQQLVCTKDALSEGTHFFKGDDPATLAHKLMAVNLSDLAAKGARPLGYMLALHLPKSYNESWISAFCTGLKNSILTFGGALIGGDTTMHDGSLCLSLTAFGTIPSGTMLLRSGAKPGDAIYVSHTIGNSYAALQHLLKAHTLSFSQPNDEQEFLKHYYQPTPQLALGTSLRNIASACIDISDGLAADLNHICECSHVGATVYTHTIPLSPLVKQSGIPLAKLITGGDDYQLLFTVPAHKEALLKQVPTPIHKIGVITAEQTLKFIDSEGKPLVLSGLGYEHRG